ncbi:MAG: transposase [Prochlorococcaceae cyanobacterium]
MAAALRWVFVQQDEQAVVQQGEQVIAMLSEIFPAAAALMDQAKEDVLAFRSFPPEHWRKIWSTNPLERLSVALRGALCSVVIKHRTRLVGALLLEQQEEWQFEAAGCSLNSRWPSWTTPAKQFKLKARIHSLQPPDHHAAIRSQASGLHHSKGRDPLLIALHGQEEVGPLLMKPVKNA